MLNVNLNNLHNKKLSLHKPKTLGKVLNLEVFLLALISIYSLFFHLYRIEEIGFANEYYTAAVKSMLHSWHNFFFVAAEPGGSVAVDKPPLGLWIQACFAAIFGVSGFSVTLPNILAGVFSVPLIYFITKNTFGRTAGLVSVLALTSTPIFLAVNRNNTMDGMLNFLLIVSAWVFIKATEKNSLLLLTVGSIL